MNLVIVESPAKAKTINKYLGQDYKVVASFGHIRDLPSKNGSVDPEHNFEMKYEINDKAKKAISEIVKYAKNSEQIFLATDPDREGEAISWHIIEVLKQKKALKKDVTVKRIIFSEITKKAINEAINNPRNIDDHLVDAQQARRALDYLVGFTLSPILWRKLPGSKSAGRVQSVALRLICDREAEIEKFIKQEYWSITNNFKTIRDAEFAAKLTHVAGEKLDKLAINNQQQAEELKKDIADKNFIIDKIERKEQKRNPQPPFITSTLQQEASRKLGFGAKKTMMLAQKLYEGVEINGDLTALITYMRTDGVNLADDAVKSIRQTISNEYGNDYLPAKAKIYKSKAKNAQEAHEAIRPTNASLKPADINGKIEKDQFRLYELIWQRTMACQMESAILNLVAIDIKDEQKKYNFRANGSTIKFDGFYRIYREGSDDEQENLGNLLPEMHENENVELLKTLATQHFTEPPARYSEASLVKKLEELGIGRPSTYATILSVIQDRKYVILEKKRFIPEERGRLVTSFLVDFFNRYVEYDFTANLEDELDDVAAGNRFWTDLLDKFWISFKNNIDKVSEITITEVIEKLTENLDHHLFPPNENGEQNKECPACKKGQLSLKLGKFGAFLACSNYPECKFTKQIGSNDNEPSEQMSSENEPQQVGLTANSEQIYLKKGPYGPYLELEQTNQKKPKRVSIPKFVNMDDLNEELARKLISMPFEIGTHPDTEETIAVGNGKYGPYLKYKNVFVPIPKNYHPLELGLNDAIVILSKSNKVK